MSGETQRDARLDAIAAMRAIMSNDQAGLDHVLATTDDLRELAGAACGLAASLAWVGIPEPVRERVLTKFAEGVMDE